MAKAGVGYRTVLDGGHANAGVASSHLTRPANDRPGLSGENGTDLRQGADGGLAAGPLDETAGRLVITSYSIHYTKLYDGWVRFATPFKSIWIFPAIRTWRSVSDACSGFDSLRISTIRTSLAQFASSGVAGIAPSRIGFATRNNYF